MGLFIAIEGQDACGKATHSRLLEQRFKETQGARVTRFSLPDYDSISGEMVLGHLKGHWNADVSADADPDATYIHDVGSYLFQCCQLVNRLECMPAGLWRQGRDDVFIADRYIASAYAYGLAKGLNRDWLLRTHRQLPQPDLNILLDIPVEESFKRRPERRDKYEDDFAFLRDVRECYLDVFSTLGPTYAVINASGTVELTHERVMRCVNAMIDDRPDIAHLMQTF